MSGKELFDPLAKCVHCTLYIVGQVCTELCTIVNSTLAKCVQRHLRGRTTRENTHTPISLLTHEWNFLFYSYAVLSLNSTLIIAGPKSATVQRHLRGPPRGPPGKTHPTPISLNSGYMDFCQKRNKRFCSPKATREATAYFFCERQQHEIPSSAP